MDVLLLKIVQKYRWFLYQATKAKNIEANGQTVDLLVASNYVVQSFYQKIFFA